MLHGDGSRDARFIAWRDTVAALPRRLTRVLTRPVVTIFPFIAQPHTHLYLKPTVTRIAAEAYEHEFAYRSSLPRFRIPLCDRALALHASGGAG